MSVETDRVHQLEADLAAVWERKYELDRVEIELRAKLAQLQAGADRAVTIADEAFGLGAVEPLEDTLTRIERGIFEQHAELSRLRPVVAAALTLCEIKARATKAFPRGLTGMQQLIGSSGAHKMLADQVTAAGAKLERAVDEYTKDKVAS